MINTYNLGSLGADIIKEFEGLRLTSYRCPANILTIGWGHTGPDVKAGQTISLERAEELFQTDVQKFVEGINYAVLVAVNQNQFDAMVCLSYNIGVSAFQHSTLLRKVNAGDFKGAATEFLKWNKGGGVILAGLTRRRIKEAALFANGLQPVDKLEPVHATEKLADTAIVKTSPALHRSSHPAIWIDEDGNARGSDGNLL